MCREHLLQLQQVDWSRQNVNIVIVAFEQPEFVRRYQKDSAVTWRMIADTQRQLYRLFGFERATFRQIINWKSLKGYLSLVFGKGRRVKLPTNQDYFQLGGDILIDPQGIIRLYHPSHSPEDRPTSTQIEEIVRS